MVVFVGRIRRQEESHGGDETLERSRRYDDDAYGGGYRRGRMAHGQVGWRQRVEDDDDFLDDYKDNEQQEI